MADEITAADDTHSHQITGSNDVTSSNDITQTADVTKENEQQDPVSADPNTDKSNGSHAHEVVNIDSDSDDEELVVIEGKKEEKRHSTSDEIAIVKETNSSDKDSCSICLSNFTNRSFINDCFHAFCYYCILQWSEVSQTCPLCKKQFGTIIHDVKSITEYKVTKVKRDEPALLPYALRAAFRPTVVYRTTAMGRPREESEAVSTSGNSQISRRKRKKRAGPRHETDDIEIKEGRMRVYERNLFAKEAGAESGRRKATPEFYTEFEGAKHRLYPWMRMDLEVLLYGCQRKVFQTMELMWELLDKHHITSNEFKRQVEPILAAKTDHFCHELHMFAISSHSHWKTYLSNVKYGDSRWDASPVRYIGDSTAPGDTISNTKWDVEENETRTETSSNSSDIQFIGESELDVNITENSSSSGNCESDKESKFLIVMKKSDYEGPIDVDDIEEEDDDTRQKTPVFIDLDDVPPTPTPPQSPVSRDNSPHCSPIRYNSPVCGMMQASPLHGLELPHFPCSPIKRNSPVKNNSPARSRSPSPMKGKGKERKRKRSVSVPVIEDAPSPVRVLMDDSEPCSSKYLT